jgi:beta-mannosidase
MQRVPLGDNWFLKERNCDSTIEADATATEGWLPATVPGVVQWDLQKHGVIPDPYRDLHEQDVQWVGERDWLYRCRFTWAPPEGESAGEDAAALCFSGLDTVATVWLNGQRILESDNMFHAHRVPVGTVLRAGENELVILFESALRVGRARQEAATPMPVWNGDQSRVNVRKAQYQYGWDWGPCLLTAGPWRPIWLEECSSARLADLSAHVNLSDGLRQAKVEATATVEHPERLADGTLRLALFSPGGEELAGVMLPLAESVSHVFSLEQPELWWPHGYGAQPLYRLVAILERGEALLEERAMRFGLRRLRLLQDDVTGEPGASFRFDVNDVPIFCGGANWIPCDLILPRVTEDRYRALLQLAVDANMHMLRVWGGGIYEAEIFYDLCDELGLLVWQDFLFACGIYPAHDDFTASVRVEAEQAVRRLRHHPCLALWCGNNEDYEIARSLGRPLRGRITEAFPARTIYEDLLPEVCGRLDPDRPYWPGSPYSGNSNDDATSGDQHVWSIWHEPVRPYQDYPETGGRFVSEFGMAALPSVDSLSRMTQQAGERYPGSRVLDFHFKAGGGVRRLATYMAENLRVPGDITLYGYATQVMQAEALGIAFRGWRRRFAGPGRYGSGGALVWQLNDCWPAISWSIVDDGLVPKLAYYAVRRALAPLALDLARGHASGTAIWAGNDTSRTVSAVLRLRLWSLDGRIEAEEERAVVIPPHRTTALGETALGADAGSIVEARLLVGGEAIALAALWPEPLKYLTLPDPQLRIERRESGRLALFASAPAKSIALECDRTVGWSDNGFDLFPGEAYVVSARDLPGPVAIHARSLFDLQASK